MFNDPVLGHTLLEQIDEYEWSVNENYLADEREVSLHHAHRDITVVFRPDEEYIRVEVTMPYNNQLHLNNVPVPYIVFFSIVWCIHKIGPIVRGFDQSKEYDYDRNV